MPYTVGHCDGLRAAYADHSDATDSWRCRYGADSVLNDCGVAFHGRKVTDFPENLRNFAAEKI
jgi:hypothetical protein